MTNLEDDHPRWPGVAKSPATITAHLITVPGISGARCEAVDRSPETQAHICSVSLLHPALPMARSMELALDLLREQKFETTRVAIGDLTTIYCMEAHGLAVAVLIETGHPTMKSMKRMLQRLLRPIAGGAWKVSPIVHNQADPPAAPGTSETI